MEANPQNDGVLERRYYMGSRYVPCHVGGFGVETDVNRSDATCVVFLAVRVAALVYFIFD